MKPPIALAWALAAVLASGAVGIAAEPEAFDPMDFASWRLPPVPAPPDNATTPARVELGKMLFFDPRLSRDRNVSCATCHNPLFGWSDGLTTGIGFRGTVLGRASPTIVNTGYNTIQMWDGRKASLEHQVM